MFAALTEPKAPTSKNKGKNNWKNQLPNKFYQIIQDELSHYIIKETFLQIRKKINNNYQSVHFI